MSRILSIGATLIALVVAPAASATSYAFMVFFDSDSDVLDPKSVPVIDQFIKICSPPGKYRVAVTGHTDTVGSAGYKMALSLRRAEAVKQALVVKGVPADIILTTGHGATRLLVQTADQVKEPQNRRAELFCAP
jgi:outer membrane protein OmpA-like peptidoglycan-associated protein